MSKNYKIAIIGLGSIGLRHLENITRVLDERGDSYQIDLVRSGKGPALTKDHEQKVNKVYYYQDEFPDDYDVVFITNPTHLHFETVCQFVNKTKHMFIEKPVFDRTDISVDSLQLRRDSVYYVACPLRYTKVIQFIRNEINLQEVYCARVICSSYLPEWRPGQDYRNNYSAKKELGGGVSLDLIHEWDYLYYLFGFPNKVFNIKGKYSHLEINSDDLSIYIAEYPKMAVEVHLDYFGRFPMREIQLFLPHETVIGDLINSEIRFLKERKVIQLPEKRDDFQCKEIIHFFNLIEGQTNNHNDIFTALQTLKIAKGEY